MGDITKQQKGFTLLEMLVALGVSALLVTLAYSAVHIGIRSWDTSRARLDQVDELRIGWRFLHSTLAHARPVSDPKAKNRQSLLFHGEQASLQFAADMPSYLGLGGLYVIQLSIIRQDGKEQLKLERRLYTEYSKDDAVPETQDAILVDELKNLNIRYYGSKEKNKAASWHENWRAEKQLPALVRIDIEAAQSGHWPVLVAAPDLGQTNNADADYLLENPE